MLVFFFSNLVRNPSPLPQIPLEPSTVERKIRTILFWNSYWIWEYFDMGKGNEGFKDCPNNNNCFTTRNRSLLYDPNYIVDAVVFHGVNVPLNELSSLKVGKNQLLRLNKGIKPLIVLFMLVSHTFIQYLLLIII